MPISYLLLEGYNLSPKDLYFYNFLSKVFFFSLRRSKVGNVKIEMIIKFNPFETQGRRRTHPLFFWWVIEPPSLTKQ